MNDSISIERPPLANTFELPTREELLEVEPGDLVKLTFNDRERIWVEVVECCAPRLWSGLLKNDPFTEECEGLEYGEQVAFHPLDVIAVMPFEERCDRGDNSSEEW